MEQNQNSEPQKILAIDIGGSGVKVKVNTGDEVRRVESGPTMDPDKMVADVKELTHDWAFDVIAMGYPGPIQHGKITRDPHNLAPGWVQYDFAEAFGKPVKLINDAAMQAVGSYEGGRMLFLGLGTGLGSVLIVDGVVAPLELAHMPYKRGHTFEEYVGNAAFEELGKKKWRNEVAQVISILAAALLPDYVVLGGGNAKRLKEMPVYCRLGNNKHAFTGGFRLWSDPTIRV